MTPIRPARDEDAASVAALVNEITADWFAWAPITADDLLDRWRSPRVDRQDFVVAEGSILGYASVTAADPGRTRLWAELRAISGEDESRVSASLLAAIEARARELAARADPGARVVLRTQVAEVQAQLGRLLAEAGYAVVRHAENAVRSLEPPPPPPSWPPGITPRRFRTGEERTIWELAMDALASSWDFVREPFPSWLASQVESPAFDPELWFVAERDGDIAGVLYCRNHPSDPEVAWLDVLAVRPEWRRRRLGTALTQEALREFHRRGKRRAGVGIDPDNPTGVARLLAKLDFEIVQRFSTFEKELRPGRPAARLLGRSARNAGQAWRRLVSGATRAH
ncbi:MAG: GNAT family N-acetyltransferase [Gaiellales bacterium]